MTSGHGSAGTWKGIPPAPSSSLGLLRSQVRDGGGLGVEHHLQRSPGPRGDAAAPAASFPITPLLPTRESPNTGLPASSEAGPLADQPSSLVGKSRQSWRDLGRLGSAGRTGPSRHVPRRETHPCHRSRARPCLGPLHQPSPACLRRPLFYHGPSLPQTAVRAPRAVPRRPRVPQQGGVGELVFPFPRAPAEAAALENEALCCF